MTARVVNVWTSKMLQLPCCIKIVKFTVRLKLFPWYQNAFIFEHRRNYIVTWAWMTGEWCAWALSANVLFKSINQWNSHQGLFPSPRGLSPASTIKKAVPVLFTFCTLFHFCYSKSFTSHSIRPLSFPQNGTPFLIHRRYRSGHEISVSYATYPRVISWTLGALYM